MARSKETLTKDEVMKLIEDASDLTERLRVAQTQADFNERIPNRRSFAVALAHLSRQASDLNTIIITCLSIHGGD